MMIKASAIAKRFGHRFILQGLDFEANEGQIIVLAGPNGAGKTTFLRILASLIKPSLGRLEIAGLLQPDYSLEARSKLGYLGHQNLLYSDLSAEENLRFYARLYKVENIENRISKILELFLLSERRRDPVRIFSRGMQQRLAIARALLHEPEILLLDEAHTGLDQAGIKSLNDILIDQAKLGKTIVMASHNLDIIADYADRVDVLVGGHFVDSLKDKDLQSGRLKKKYQALTAEITESQLR